MLRVPDWRYARRGVESLGGYQPVAWEGPPYSPLYPAWPGAPDYHLVVPSYVPSWPSPYQAWGDLPGEAYAATLDWREDAERIPEPGNLWPGELTDKLRITAMFLYHLDGHIYARAIHEPLSGPPYDEAHLTRIVVKVTDPLKYQAAIVWVVSQGWGDALAALLQILPGVQDALPVKRAAYLEEARRLDALEAQRRAEAQVQDALTTITWLNEAAGRAGDAIAGAARGAWSAATTVAWGTAIVASIVAVAAIAKAVRG